MTFAAHANTIHSAAPQHVTAAISAAATKTGVDFGYLMKQASVESGFNPSVKAKTSSATGLYQFIDQTWLRMIKTYGAQHGLNNFANAITQKANGDFTVSNPSVKASILNLRKDPETASLMAAEFANENADYLRTRTGRDPNQTDLYMAHFLGAGGAARFINTMDKNPTMPAADYFADAAQANRSIFYKNGRALSFAEIYNRFAQKFNDAPTGTNSLAFANAEPKTMSNSYAAQSYARIPSPAFSSAPAPVATAWLPDYADEPLNPIAAILSAPFKLFESMFG